MHGWLHLLALIVESASWMVEVMLWVYCMFYVESLVVLCLIPKSCLTCNICWLWNVQFAGTSDKPRQVVQSVCCYHSLCDFCPVFWVGMRFFFFVCFTFLGFSINICIQWISWSRFFLSDFRLFLKQFVVDTTCCYQLCMANCTTFNDNMLSDCL